MPLPRDETYGPGYGTALQEVPLPLAGVVFPNLSGELTSQERDFITVYHELYMQGASLTAAQHQRALHDAEDALTLFQKHLTWCLRLPEGEKGGEYQHTLANVRWVQMLLGIPVEAPAVQPQAPTVDAMRQALLPDIAAIVAQTVAETLPRVLAAMKQSDELDAVALEKAREVVKKGKE